MAFYYFPMIEDQISLALKDIAKLKQELHDLKKDMRAEEKNDNEQYLELKKASKDLKAQVKETEDKWLHDLMEDESYAKLKEMKIKKEENV